MFSEALLAKLNQDNLLWDINLETEFRGKRQKGFSFVVDVLDGAPRLALYHMKTNFSTSTTLNSQPPYEMLVRAVHEQGGHLEEENLYPINRELKDWIKTSWLN